VRIEGLGVYDIMPQADAQYILALGLTSKITGEAYSCTIHPFGATALASVRYLPKSQQFVIHTAFYHERRKDYITRALVNMAQAV
jgi:hypothetical protein